MRPIGFGGLPAPSFQPWLNGRNQESLPSSRVQNRTSVVHGEVDHAPAEVEEELLGVPVPLVLLDRVVDGLLGQAILELERGDGQAVDEEAQVQGELRLVLAVTSWRVTLKMFAPVLLSGFGILRGWRSVEEFYLGRKVIDTFA